MLLRISKSKWYASIALLWLEFLYERSHSPNFKKALFLFLSLLKFRVKRLWQLGWSRYIHISELEWAAALSGLGYSHHDNDKASRPPWLMPDHFLDLTAAELPSHSLINPLFLSELSASSFAQKNAVSVLIELLKNDSFPERWRSLSILENNYNPIKKSARIAVCLHLFYPEMWPELFYFIKNIPEPFDLFISIPSYACTKEFHKITTDHPSVYFLPCINRGRDVLPFIHLLKMNIFDNYDIALKIHSKKSLHITNGSLWLNKLLGSLLADKKSINKLIKSFDDNSMLGMIGPASSLIEQSNELHQACNKRELAKFSIRANLSRDSLCLPFFAGTMFWFCPKALNDLKALNLAEEDFQLEMSQTDGTLAHVIERCLWPLIEKSNYSVDKT